MTKTQLRLPFESIDQDHNDEIQQVTEYQKMVLSTINNFPFANPASENLHKHQREIYDAMMTWVQKSKKVEEIILLIDPEQEPIAQEFIELMKKLGHSVLVITQPENLETLLSFEERHFAEQTKKFVVKASKNPIWDKTEWDLGLAEFSNSDFEIIYEFME
jgi:hypothetical protein